MRIIPTWLHGVLDYVSGFTLILLPRMLGWSPTVTTILTGLGIATLLFSALTRYELGIMRWIPMGIHLVLDLLSAGFLFVAGMSLQNISDAERMFLFGFGIFEVIAVVLSRTQPNLSQSKADRGAGAH